LEVWGVLKSLRITHPFLSGTLTIRRIRDTEDWAIIRYVEPSGKLLDPLEVLRENGLYVDYDCFPIPAIVGQRVKEVKDLARVNISSEAEALPPRKRELERYEQQGFELTGETRHPQKGEWFIGLVGQAQRAKQDFELQPRVILRRKEFGKGTKSSWQEPYTLEDGTIICNTCGLWIQGEFRKVKGRVPCSCPVEPDPPKAKGIPNASETKKKTSRKQMPRL
jgi:hypothetical protein